MSVGKFTETVQHIQLEEKSQKLSYITDLEGKYFHHEMVCR